jgi:hypothetical protein
MKDLSSARNRIPAIHPIAIPTEYLFLCIYWQIILLTFISLNVQFYTNRGVLNLKKGKKKKGKDIPVTGRGGP